MDRSTPSSHIESLMLLVSVITSWKAPRIKQMVVDTLLKYSSKTMRSARSSTKDAKSKEVILRSSTTAINMFMVYLRSTLVVPGTNLMLTVSLIWLSLAGVFSDKT